MTVENLESTRLIATIEHVKHWHHARNLIEGATDKDQLAKLIQEMGELSDNICKGKDIKDDMDTLGSMAVKRGVGAIALNAVAISLAFVNVAGGFAVTQRMLGMFKKS